MQLDLTPPLFALQGEAVPGNAFDWAAAAVRDSGSRLSGSRGLAAPRSPASSASSSSSQRPAPCGSPGRAMGQGARPAGCGAPAETPWRPQEALPGGCSGGPWQGLSPTPSEISVGKRLIAHLSDGPLTTAHGHPCHRLHENHLTELPCLYLQRSHAEGRDQTSVRCTTFPDSTS